MKIGDLVLTRRIEVRSGVGDRPTVRATFKANQGYAFTFLNLGTVDHESKMVDQAERVLRALGWRPLPVAVGEDIGIAAAFGMEV